jgi:hypothetical protein
MAWGAVQWHRPPFFPMSTIRIPALPPCSRRHRIQRRQSLRVAPGQPAAAMAEEAPDAWIIALLVTAALFTARRTCRRINPAVHRPQSPALRLRKR